MKDINKPIGVADYQLMIPTEELQKVISDEMKLFEIESKSNSEWKAQMTATEAMATTPIVARK